MTTVEVEVDVPESRQVTVALPPGVRTGRTRLLITVGVAESNPEEDEAAFHRCLLRLQATCPGRYVAIRWGAVVAVGLTREEVEREVRRKYGDAPVYIGLVPVPEQEIIFSGQLRIVGPAAPTE